MYQTIRCQGAAVIQEFLEKVPSPQGSLLAVGCSTSEILGETIGTHSTYEAAEALFAGIYPLLQENSICLAAQCCEHLNRALVIERDVAVQLGYEAVCVIPQPKAGGSFATACYRNFHDPIVVESVRANLGIDIGGTLIGMHLKEVAVPLHLAHHTIGKAEVLCTYSRPKLIGGERAIYR